MSLRPSDDAPLDRTAERVAEFVSAQIGSPAAAKSSEREFVRRLASFRRARRQRRRFTAGVMVVSTFVAIGLAGWRLRSVRPPAPAALSYRVDNQAPPTGGYILVSQTTDALLAFSDGSKVRMAARTRGRVVEVSDRGAKFALDEGKASVDIVQRPRAQWIFEAGPFRVNVHGTSFTVAWNPVEAVFELRLATGAVSVTSPVGGPEIRMRAGQTLRVSLRDQSSAMGTMSSRDVPSAPETSEASSSLEGARTAPPGPARWSHQGWMAALSENKATDVVADAERRGLTAVLERADSDDLWALANAARYASRYPLARQALGAHRRRFPSSDRSREAAFLLGRLHEGDPHDRGDALDWYDRYLAEARGGARVSDALGRRMTLLERGNRRTEALVVARDYLRRFPRGTYANAARALLRSSTAAR
jgi:TolA-binding protein